MQISITSLASVSALGDSTAAAFDFTSPAHCLELLEGQDLPTWGGALPRDLKQEMEQTLEPYSGLDPSVLFAIWTARKAVRSAGWEGHLDFGVNFGSSRGATSLWEAHHNSFRDMGKTGSLASPTTTLGNIASWVAQDVRATGPEISHSITCSTALHALLNGIAWLESGMSPRFLVGGSEAPLTPFTIAQMKALKIYSRQNGPYPCRALDLEKANNTMVLGEGAAAACLEKGHKEGALAFIEGVGFATEPLEHGASLSAEASCLQRSMTMAMQGVSPQQVDAVVMHAPGTLKGDRSEIRAVKRVFAGKPPAVTSNKWKIGHTLGASGLLSVEMAVLMLQKQKFIGVPYVTGAAVPTQLRYILVNAVGFGGNAVSILLRRP